jgi:hypothetical protein
LPGKKISVRWINDISFAEYRRHQMPTEIAASVVNTGTLYQ